MRQVWFKISRTDEAGHTEDACSTLIPTYVNQSFFDEVEQEATKQGVSADELYETTGQSVVGVVMGLLGDINAAPEKFSFTNGMHGGAVEMDNADAYELGAAMLLWMLQKAEEIDVFALKPFEIVRAEIIFDPKADTFAEIRASVDVLGSYFDYVGKAGGKKSALAAKKNAYAQMADYA